MANASTSSLGFAAYLQLKGFKLAKAPEKVEKTAPNTWDKIEKYSFVFDLTQVSMDTLYNEYITT